MKILIVGSGGREHAIAQTLLKSPNVEKVFCSPGNGGTATLAHCQNLAVAVDDFAGIIQVVKDNGIELVVVGPEVPLAMGIADYLQQQEIAVFGPVKAGAKIEASKSWAKDLMLEGNIPTAKFATFTDAVIAKKYIQQQGAPIVIKADSLAAGKGVIVAMTEAEATTAIDELFGLGFDTLVIEEFLQGEEASVLALTDGKTIIPLLPAQDHKRIGEGDTGKNTGGMGAYAPAPLVTPDIMQRIEREVLQPTIDTLNHRGIDYHGILYAGLMITPKGDPKVVEFNCRFGDPETQAVLPLLDTPLDELMLACVRGELANVNIKWKPGSAVCVVAAAGGYPDTYEKGKEITGLDTVTDATVFHAGTKKEGDRILTNGGRVLGITAVGNTLSEAISQVYSAIAKIHFEDLSYRKDIGKKASMRDKG